MPLWTVSDRGTQTAERFTAWMNFRSMLRKSDAMGRGGQNQVLATHSAWQMASTQLNDQLPPKSGTSRKLGLGAELRTAPWQCDMTVLSIPTSILLAVPNAHPSTNCVISLYIQKNGVFIHLFY